MEKFYIVRTDYHGECWLYGMTDTLDEAFKFIRDERLVSDVAIEFCQGDFPFNYDVYETLFV